MQNQGFLLVPYSEKQIRFRMNVVSSSAIIVNYVKEQVTVQVIFNFKQELYVNWILRKIQKQISKYG
jgi:hypothetical protein